MMAPALEKPAGKGRALEIPAPARWRARERKTKERDACRGQLKIVAPVEVGKKVSALFTFAKKSEIDPLRADRFFEP